MSVYIQQAINLYVQKINEYKVAAEAKGIRPAIYQGNKQVSMNGQMYDIDITADMSLRPGQMVYVALDQTGTRAVILG